MKKILTITLLILLTVGLFVSCDANTVENLFVCTVTFDMQNHGKQIEPLTEVVSGSKILEPTEPTTEGFTFAGWYREDTCTTEWKFDTDKVTKDTTLYAKWTINNYNVSAQVQGNHGTATVKVNDEEVSTAAYASNVVFSATPQDGYEFDYWEVISGDIDIESIKNNTEISVTMPANVLTLKAHLNEIIPETYNIIVESDGNGTAKAQVGDVDATTAAPGATVKLVATANDGYQFKEWQIARGLESITGNSFSMPANEVKVKAVFEKEYAVEVEAGGHGSVSADVTKGVSGKEVNLTITPDAGYEVDQITVVRGGVTVDKNKFTIGAADVKIRVTFKAIVSSAYNIIIENDGNGTAKAQVGDVDATTAAPGATVKLVATANDGYQFKEWQIARGLESITGNSFSMPSKEVKVKAVFQRVYTIEVVVQGHGTASADVQKSITGREITLTATPEEGYKLDHWEVERGGVTVGDNNKFTVGTADVKIKAVFVVDIPSTYNIIVEDDGHGTAKAQVGGVDATSAAKDASVSLIATPSEGYVFKEWNIIRGLEDADVVDDSFTMPSKEVKIKAIFEKAVAIVENSSSKDRTAYASLETAIAAASDNDTIYLISSEIECGRLETGNKGLTFKPEGRNVTLTLTGSLLFGDVDGGKEFTISGNDNYTLTIKPKLKDGTNEFRPMTIRQNNILNMEDNVILTGSNFTGSAGGMLSIGRYATFNMNGGTFKDCQVTTDNYDNGNSQLGRGGAIYVLPYGNFNMSGGRIENCHATIAGGAVFAVGNFIMSGGKIIGCSVTGLADPKEDYKVKAKGGAVYLFSGSIFDMTGGEISSNTLADVDDMRGAGVYAASSTSITLGGTAIIKGNTNGGDIQSNLFLCNGQTININTDTKPANGMEIGVTTKNVPETNYPVYITFDGSEDYVKFFVSDNEDYLIKFNTNHLELAVKAYNIIVEDDGHGTAKAQVSGVDATSAAKDASVSLIATPSEGYAFKEWQVTRGLASDAITGNSFTMSANEVKVKAIFEEIPAAFKTVADILPEGFASGTAIDEEVAVPTGAWKTSDGNYAAAIVNSVEDGTALDFIKVGNVYSYYGLPLDTSLTKEDDSTYKAIQPFVGDFELTFTLQDGELIKINFTAKNPDFDEFNGDYEAPTD